MKPAASERCEDGLFCAHACRKKCSGVSGGHGGIARAGGPGQRAMVRPHEALRCRSCRSKISPGTYSCNFACRKNRRRSCSWLGGGRVIGCLLWLWRPGGGRSRLESREGGKSGLPPARAWFEGHGRASKLRSSTWHHSRGSTSQARQAGRHRHGTRSLFLLQKTRRPGIPAMQKCWGFGKPNQKTNHSSLLHMYM